MSAQSHREPSTIAVVRGWRTTVRRAARAIRRIGVSAGALAAPGSTSSALGSDDPEEDDFIANTQKRGRWMDDARLARLTKSVRVLEVDELDLALESGRWAFAERKAASIAVHWARLRQARPALFNGRVVLLGRRTIETGPDGVQRLKGAYFETDYADYVAWEEFGFPGEPVENCFSMAALRGADGAFLLGEMAPHTFTAGQIYFPAGTPDPNDVFDGRFDLEASVRRELFEETGVKAGEVTIAPGWTLVFTPQRIACMKLTTLAGPATQAKAQIDARLAQDPHAEFSRMHIVRGPYDIDEQRVPVSVAAYLRYAFAHGSAGL
jgi:hypothetical protein